MKWEGIIEEQELMKYRSDLHCSQMWFFEKKPKKPNEIAINAQGN